MGPNTDDNRSKASGYLNNTDQLMDVHGIRAMADTEHPVALGVLQLALTGMAKRLSTYQYTSANLAALVDMLQALHKSLMDQKRFNEAEHVIPLIQEAQHIQRSGYRYPQARPTTRKR